MIVVLDTNVLLGCISRNSDLRPIWDAFLQKRFRLAISIDMFFEYIEKLEQNTSVTVAKNIAELIIRSSNVQIIYYWIRWDTIRNDPDDNKFFDIAIASNADLLVTNDKHFNVIKKAGFKKPKIVSSEEFLNILKSL